MGIPEVLTNQGTQFISECMQEVSRLLSIKGLTSTTYHPFVTEWLRDGTESQTQMSGSRRTSTDIASDRQ